MSWSGLWRMVAMGIIPLRTRKVRALSIGAGVRLVDLRFSLTTLTIGRNPSIGPAQDEIAGRSWLAPRPVPRQPARRGSLACRRAGVPLPSL